MKTPEEVKKGLNCNNIDHCNDCPYDGLDCAKHVDQDALAYIQQLEGDLAEERELNEFLRDRITILESTIRKSNNHDADLTFGEWRRRYGDEY